MILDSSALLAVILRESGYATLIDKIAAAKALSVGAPTLAETGIVLENRIGEGASTILVQFVHEWRVSVIAFGPEHWREAVDAYSRYGKGRHKAALNFGDCLTYAVARLSARPLLCTGTDFPKTDIQLV
jgi:ribonuclease VapC